MKMRMLLAAFGLFAAAVSGPNSRANAAAPTKPRPDLATTLEGTWFGDVISDSKGSSRSDVTIMIKRTGPNTITITSDYPRLPVVQVPLERAMDAILASSGDTVILYESTKTPPQLSVTFQGEVAWSGTRQ
jgi:hypothetical protein